MIIEAERNIFKLRPRQRLLGFNTINCPQSTSCFPSPPISPGRVTTHTCSPGLYKWGQSADSGIAEATNRGPSAPSFDIRHVSSNSVKGFVAVLTHSRFNCTDRMASESIEPKTSSPLRQTPSPRRSADGSPAAAEAGGVEQSQDIAPAVPVDQNVCERSFAMLLGNLGFVWDYGLIFERSLAIAILRTTVMRCT